MLCEAGTHTQDWLPMIKIKRERAIWDLCSEFQHREN